MKKIALACDHAGVLLKSELVQYLGTKGFETIDLGTDSDTSVDYPDFAKKVAISIIQGQADFGLLICGTGIGMSISANRFPEIRAALCTSKFHAEMTRKHNDANVLVFGARVTSPKDALEIADTFFSTEFEGGRHMQRVDKMRDINNCK